MKTLPVRVLDLATALEDQDRESTAYYFDSRSGEIVFLTEDGRGSDKRWDVISNSLERFIEIDPMDSRQGYEIMQTFVETLPLSALQEKLKWSLEGAKPFRRFRDILTEDQDIRKRWFEFHHEAMQKIALEWLADHEIEPIEPASAAIPSLLDQEAEALAIHEENEDFGDTGGDELDEDDSDELDEFDDDGSEPIDFLSEEEEELLTEFVESLPGANFNLPKLHGLFSAFAAGPEIMEPPDLLMVLAGFAKDGKVSQTAEPETILDLLDRFYGGILESLEFEEFEPHLAEQGVMVTDPGGSLVSWCNGFMLGVEHRKTAWKSWFEDARRAKAISLIMVMSDPETIRQAEATLGEGAALATASMISELVPLIHAYWAFETGLEEYLVGSEDDE